MSRKRRGNKPNQAAAPVKPGPAKPKSWIWVGTDDPAKRIIPHEVTLGFARDEDGPGATLDLFVERGGKEFTGLTVQAIRIPSVARVEDLVGHDVIDPPPPVIGLRPLGMGGAKLGCGGASRAPNPLRKLGFALEGDQTPAPDHSEDDERPLDEAALAAEEAAPDDDPELGDWESYKRRRAAEAKLTPHEEDPELDEEAIAVAEAAASAERVLIAPGQAYEVEAIRIRIVALRGAEAEIELEGRCAEIGSDGEVERAGVPFGGKVFARVEADTSP